MLNELIKGLEDARHSKVIAYITGEKPPIFGTKVANDILPLFKEILEKFPNGNNKISLFLNTSGGNLDAAWPLVNLIREYTDDFEVIIPEKALSAGTLISLGANRIVMLPYSNLSPIDPAAEFMDLEKKQAKRFEIEDIIGFIDFAKKKIGISKQMVLGDIMKELSKEINPSLLGSMNRIHSLIRSLANKLLLLHENGLSSKEKEKIVDYLTEKLFSHRHLINRKEARDVIGFKDIIDFGNSESKKAIDLLFAFYKDYLETDKIFDPESLVGGNDNFDYKLPRAIVHSIDIKYSFISNYRLTKILMPDGQIQINVNNNMNNWEKVII